MSSSDELEREAKYHTDEDQASLERLAAKESLHFKERWAQEVYETESRPVVSYPPDFYALPRFASRILPGALLYEFNAIMEEVREVNDQLVGLDTDQAFILLGGDQDVSEIREELRGWANEYAELRAYKRSVRDEDNPVAKFRRLSGELVPEFERIAYPGDTVHPAFLEELTSYVPWLLHTLTWEESIEYMPDPTGLGPGRFCSVLDSHAERDYCEKLVHLYGWNRASDLWRVCEFSGLPMQADQEDESFLDYLADLATDLAEMKPLLLWNYSPAKALVTVGNLVCSWQWGYGHSLGFVNVTNTEREALEALHRRQYLVMLTCSHDGVLAVDELPWIDSLSIAYERADALVLNATILEAVHAKLFSFYEQVDVAALLGKARDQPQDEPASAEAVAASCQLIAEPDEDLAVPRQQIPSVRMQRLLAILADRLGCEVRQGKGSEVVVWRPGGHHFRLGRHKRNDRVPSLVIRSLLGRVGVSMREWLAALS